MCFIKTLIISSLLPSILLLSLFVTKHLHAKDDTDLGYTKDGIGLNINLGVGYDDNLYDSQTEVGNSFFIEPSAILNFAVDKTLFGLTIDYKYSAFLPENKDDSAQSNLINFETYWSPSIKNRFSLTTLIDYFDEKRGEGLTEGDPLAMQSLDSVELKKLDWSYRFRSSQYNSLFFELGYINNSRIYDSQRLDALNVNFEQTGHRVGIGYSWKQGKQIALETSKVELYYPDATSNARDAENQLSFLSLSWPLANNVEIALAIGNDERQFVNTNDVRETDYWSAAFNWRPLSHTRLILTTEQEQQPARQANETFIEENTMSIAWLHTWSVDYATKLELTKMETRSIIINNVEVEEDIGLALTGQYRDFEFSLRAETNKEIASSTEFSQFEVLLTYNFSGGR